MSRSLLTCVIFGVMFATGLAFGEQASEPAKSPELSSVALPPELDRVLRDYERAWRAGDAGAIASLFAEDGILLQSSRPPIRGRAAIQANYHGQKGSPLRLRAFAFTSGDSIAYILGGYTYGNKQGDIGKFTLTLRRAPGESWLIYSDMDNMNTEPLQQSSPSKPLPLDGQSEVDS